MRTLEEIFASAPPLPSSNESVNKESNSPSDNSQPKRSLEEIFASAPEPPPNWDKNSAELDQEKNISKEEPLSTTDRLLQIGRGAVNVPTSLYDIGKESTAQQLENTGSDVPETFSPMQTNESIESRAKNIRETEALKSGREAINKIAGKDITPTDTLGKVLETTGEFSVPFSNVVKGAKGAKAIAGSVGKHLAESGGAAAGLELGKDIKISEEGSVGSYVEDLLHTVFGASFASKFLSVAQDKIMKKVAKDVPQFIEGSRALNEADAVTKTFGKALSKDANVRNDLLEWAKKEDVKVPFQVKLDNPLNKFLANSYLKSFFASKVYNDSVNAADKSMIDAITKKIQSTGSHISQEDIKNVTESSLRAKERDVLSGVESTIDSMGHYLSPESSSHATKKFLEGEKNLVSSTKKELYKDMEKSAS